LLDLNDHLRTRNEEISTQQRVIIKKARLLERQTGNLEENDRVRNKLFSIISHDLKAPLFALKRLFQQIGQQGISREQMNEFMPVIINDLNYSTVLVENLLEWAKTQMVSDKAKPEEIDLNELFNETISLHGPQLRNKGLQLEKKMDLPVSARADREMIRLVIRNLLSNAIKFTPEGGVIEAGLYRSTDSAEIYVRDSGKGISREEMKKINRNIFFSTRGTKNETGTGLGLMLCREFLAKNKSRLLIHSEPGHGTTFSFSLKLVTT
jgi:two-component system sensor histidine kinase/response regulator